MRVALTARYRRVRVHIAIGRRIRVLSDGQLGPNLRWLKRRGGRTR